jgi:hypothetical protein
MDSNSCHKGLWLWRIKPPSYSPEVASSDHFSFLKSEETLTWTLIFRKRLKGAVSQLLEEPDKNLHSSETSLFEQNGRNVLNSMKTIEKQ